MDRKQNVGRGACLLGLLVVLAMPALAQPAFDTDQLLADVAVLAADSLEGRGAGTAGSEKAQAYIRRAFDRIGLQPVGDSFDHAFSLGRDASDAVRGVNLVGSLAGTTVADSVIVVTAHYDHLGIRGGAIFNGADDNASGVAGILALASYFSHHPPRHTLLFAALDAEEMGLRGARAFLDDPPIDPGRIVLNVNLDMISRNAQQELFVAGTYHYPFLKPTLEQVATRSSIHLRFGHDQPQGKAGEDWTRSSDHGVFHQAGIPFVYFGVEDHRDYHKATDEYANIDPAFFSQAVATILDAVQQLDAALGGGP